MLVLELKEKNMIPKSKRRKITVGGDEYEYCVTGMVEVFIRNLRTDEKILWGQDEWHQHITPKDIRTLIETKNLHGIAAI